MRNVIFLIIIIIILITFGVSEINYLNTTSNILIKDIKEIEELSKSKDIDLEKVKELEANWKNTEKYWDLLLDGNSYDGISISITKIKSSVETKEYSKIKRECEVMVYYLNNIKDNSKINIKNIL